MKQQYNLRIDTELLSDAKKKVEMEKEKGNKTSVTELIETSLRKEIEN